MFLPLPEKFQRTWSSVRPLSLTSPLRFTLPRAELKLKHYDISCCITHYRHYVPISFAIGRDVENAILMTVYHLQCPAGGVNGLGSTDG